jgi:uncharacterized protein YjbI with pentapeptide repeats
MPSDGHERCLAHLAPDELETALAEGNVNARGVEISSELLQRILDALPDAPDGGNPRFEQADFRQATFTGEVWFGGATFAGAARFNEATFAGAARFDEATFTEDAVFIKANFTEDAVFYRATFTGDARFDRATFTEDALFYSATFTASAHFDRATFTGDAVFAEANFPERAGFIGATFTADAVFIKATFTDDAGFNEAKFAVAARFDAATFMGDAVFYKANFLGDTVFDAVTFTKDAEFHGATFTGDARFDRATFTEDALFQKATFKQAASFGPMLVYRRLALDQASFASRVGAKVTARFVSLNQARFLDSASLRFRWAEVSLEGADFAASASVDGSSAFEEIDERDFVASTDEGGFEGHLRPTSTPRLLSLRGANVANLVLANVDLHACRFAGARNFGRVGFAGEFSFLSVKSGRFGTARQIIADEYDWRVGHAKFRQAGRRDDEFGFLGPEAAPAREIAHVYRVLRKWREDNKDEPGAADFYYGEMEMRRFDKTKPRAERLILELYWLVSGYGLRASRALLALAVTVLVFALLLEAWGFPSEQSFLHALTFSAKSTTSLFRPPDEPLTTAGEWLNMALRLLGPLFFGLALLSLRGRVKR